MDIRSCAAICQAGTPFATRESTQALVIFRPSHLLYQSTVGLIFTFMALV